MSETVEVQKVVSDEKLQQLRSVQGTYEAIIRRAGELHFQKKMLDQEVRDLEAAMNELENQRQQVVDSLQTEFGGTGIVDLATGVFVPDQQ